MKVLNNVTHYFLYVNDFSFCLKKDILHTYCVYTCATMHMGSPEGKLRFSPSTVWFWDHHTQLLEPTESSLWSEFFKFLFSSGLVQIDFKQWRITSISKMGQLFFLFLDLCIKLFMLLIEPWNVRSFSQAYVIQADLELTECCVHPLGARITCVHYVQLF